MSGTMHRDYRPEVTSLVNTLAKHGWRVVCVFDGGCSYTKPHNLTPERIAEIVCAVDVSDLTVMHSGSTRERFVSLVLGNEPGVIACDYSDVAELDQAIEEHASEWESREQPMRRVDA